MDYKDLFRKIALLLSNPSRFWGETDGMCSRNVQMDFVYPLIGLCGLAELLYEYTSSAANNGSGFEGRWLTTW